MAATTAHTFYPAIILPPFPKLPLKNHLIFFYVPTSSSQLLCPGQILPLNSPVAQKSASWVWAISACDSGAYPEAEASDSKRDATIDIKLPRRSLPVEFTCDECGERTKRLINQLAYERGLVYVQCAGCEQYHKLVDNLGIVVEYDLYEEMHKDEA